MARASKEILRESDPLLLVIQVNRRIYDAELVPAAEGHAIESVLVDVRQYKHQIPYGKVKDRLEDLDWMKDHGKISEESASEQRVPLTGYARYSESLMYPKLESILERGFLPPFLVEGISNVVLGRLALESMRNATLQIKELPARSNSSVQAAAETVNALVPPPLDISRNEVYLPSKLGSEDIRLAVLSITRLVDLEAVTGETAYGTLVAMMTEYDRIKKPENDNMSIRNARASSAVGTGFLGVGALLGGLGFTLGMHDSIPLGIIMGIAGASVPSSLGLPLIAMAYIETRRVGTRRVLGLADKSMLTD